MKKIVFLLFIFAVFPLPVHARWIGDMARDYSWRLEQDRVSRENVSSAREKRIQERKEKELRAGGRTRLIPLYEEYDKKAALLESSVVRTKKLQRLQARGAFGRVLRSSEERDLTTNTREGARFDARRRSDIGLILDILMPFVLNPQSEFAEQLPTTSMEICRTNALSCAGLVRLDDLLSGSELRSFPVDPLVEIDDNGTGYFLLKLGSTGLRVSAPLGNSEEGIDVESKKP